MRSFQVPEGVDTGKIEATFARGVLHAAEDGRGAEKREDNQRQGCLAGNLLADVRLFCAVA